jgi:hypothetical protein
MLYFTWGERALWLGDLLIVLEPAEELALLEVAELGV